LDLSERCLPFEIKHKDGVSPISQARVIQTALEKHDPDHVPLAGASLQEIIQQTKRNRDNKKKNAKKANKPYDQDSAEYMEDIEDEFYRIRRAGDELSVAFS